MTGLQTTVKFGRSSGCAIDLSADDLQSVAWRTPLGQRRNEMRNFAPREAVELILKEREEKELDEIWQMNDPSTQLCAEEASFWLRVIELYRDTLSDSPEAELLKISRAPIMTIEEFVEKFPRLISFADVYQGFNEQHVIHIASCLVPVNVLFKVLYDHGGNTVKAVWQGFRTRVTPYLEEGDLANLQEFMTDALNAAFNLVHAPHQPGMWYVGATQLSAVYQLAMALRMHDALVSVVESLPADYFENWGRTLGRSECEEMIYSIEDPEKLEYHFRRLGFSTSLHCEADVRRWLAHTELSGIEVVHKAIMKSCQYASGQSLLAALALVRSPSVVPLMVEYYQYPELNNTVYEWLEKNLPIAIPSLTDICTAGSSRPLAAVAREILHDLALSHPEAIENGVRKVLALDEETEEMNAACTPQWLHELCMKMETSKSKSKTKISKLPEWLRNKWHRPVLVNGRRLNSARVDMVLLALQESTLEQPSVLISTLKEKVDRTAFDDFLWALFERWVRAGGPPKERWCMMAIGLLGSDRLAVKLAALVRVWPGESKSQRAVVGLDCLRVMGSDTAIMLINGIADKVKFKALKEKARQCIESIAIQRGLTKEQLEDRIVPECGLDSRGTRLFTFGSRQFQFLLSNDLKATLKDDKGKIKTDLPKPGATDDADLTAPVIQEWKFLKMQISEVARIQSTRLEQAMVRGRRWSKDEFETCLVNHPLMINFAKRLLWLARDIHGKQAALLRVSDEKELMDSNDRHVSESLNLHSIEVAHPLHLTEEEQKEWGQVFFDYGIIPPFAQLTRSVYALTAEEESGKDIVRFSSIKLPSISFVGGLEKAGWFRGRAGDGGMFREYYKPFDGANLTAIVQFDGLCMGSLMHEEEQSVDRCFFIPEAKHPDDYWLDWQGVPLAEIDKVVVSEVLADLTCLTEKFAK